MTTVPAKTCQICKQDCSKKPRTKDAQGRYFCEACVAQKKAEAALLAGADPKPGPESRSAPGQRPGTVAPADALLAFDDAESPPLSAEFWDAPSSSAPNPAAGAPTARCGSCGAPMMGSAVVCTLCGYNSQTGKKLKVRTGSDGGVTAGSVAAGAGKGAFRLGLWLLGGGIAGAIGLTVWIAIAWFANREYGIVAIGVGALVGAGVAITGQKHLNAISGLIAASIAFFCVAGWKIAAYMLLSAAVSSAPELTVSIVESDLNGPDGDAIAMEYYVFDVAEEMEAKGRPNVWPKHLANAGIEERQGAAIEEYPVFVQNETKVRWAKKTNPEKQAYKKQIVVRVRADMDAIASQSSANPASSLFTFKEVAFAILWTFLACGTAFKLGQDGFGE